MVGIYKVENLVNGKVYIGQSIAIEKRWNKHYNAPFNPNTENYNIPFYRAIRKYGLNNFNFSVLEQCKRSDLDNREKYWINFFHSNNSEYGYNLTDGGQGSLGHFNKLDKIKVNEIQKLLLNTFETQTSIAKKYNVSQQLISYINTGMVGLSDNLSYPLRKLEEETKISKCPICGDIKDIHAKLCRKCYNLSQRKVERPTREELKTMIRTLPFTQIGKKYGVKDNSIRKWCDAYNLPRRKQDIKNYTDEEWENI